MMFPPLQQSPPLGLLRREQSSGQGWIWPSPLHPHPLHLPRPPVSGMQLFLRYMSKALSNPGRVAGRQAASGSQGGAWAKMLL